MSRSFNGRIAYTACLLVSLTAAIAFLLTAPGAFAASAASLIAPATAAPTVTGFSPSKASAGASVTVTGTNLTGATKVQFNGISASFTVKSATQIVATVPSGATSGKISVTTPGGVATSTGSFTVTVLKVVLSPTSSHLQGDETDQFTATLTNASSTAVKWTATGGTISSTGLYRAASALGTFTVKAASVQDPTKSASASVVIGATATIAHPRIILDAPTLATLRARAQANTAQWTTLKAVCDSFDGGTVLFPGQPAQNPGYPDLPDIGEGYEGSGYNDALLPLGLCYYMTLPTDPSLAAKYASKAVAVLMAMSNPQFFILDGEPIWDRDDGYGIRYYGFTMGIGYDWFHSQLSLTQQAQIQTALNHWLYGFENDSSDNFEYVQPLGNYYAGFYVSECMAALAVEGESTLGDAWWNDWYLNQHLQRIVPFYTANMGGGGWPEGFADYGPLSARNMSLPAMAVKTAKGIDIIKGTTGATTAQPYPYPLDEARWIMHFTWPSLNYVDDRDAVLSNYGGDPVQAGTGDPDSYSFFAAILAEWDDPLAPAMHRYARSAKAALAAESAPPPDPWIEFLFWNDSAPETAYSTQGMSHLAPGIAEMAARSDWTTGATWMSFRAGPYVNNPGAGHQGFEAGSLALVRGENPLLVNPEGWFAHNPNGNNGFNMVYNDWFGDFDGDPTLGNKRLFNTFQVRHVDSKGDALDEYGQYSQERSDGARTQIGGFEDAGTYVFAIGTHIEDMYRPFQTICASDPSPLSSFSRQVVYLRPSQFVVYDRTTICDDSLDQYLAFHFPAPPAAAAAPASGLLRFNVTTTKFAGAITIIEPASAKTVITDKMSTDTTTYNRVWRMEIRPSGAATVTRRWLTVFDLAPSAAQVAAATAVNIVSGSATGVLLHSTAGNSAVISGTANAGTAIAGTLRYTVPAVQTQHVITDLSASTDYTITVTVSAGNQTVSIAKGGSTKTTANGVLAFKTSAGGQVTP